MVGYEDERESIHWNETKRNGALNHVDTFWPTKRSTLRPRQRRNSGGSEELLPNLTAHASDRRSELQFPSLTHSQVPEEKREDNHNGKQVFDNSRISKSFRAQLDSR